MRVSSFMASMGTYIEVKDDEKNEHYLRKFIVHNFIPGGKKSTRNSIRGQIHLGNLHGIPPFLIHKDALEEQVLG